MHTGHRVMAGKPQTGPRLHTPPICSVVGDLYPLIYTFFERNLGKTPGVLNIFLSFPF